MFSGFLQKRYDELFDEATIKGLSKPLLQAIRVNTQKIPERELVRRLSKKGVSLLKIPWLSCGYFVKKAPFSMGATPEYLLGHYFIQDPASQYACEALGPKKGEMVLDMAAAPGGKTTYLAQILKESGAVVSLDINKDRMKALTSNIERMGLSNVVTIRMNALDAGSLGIKFDRVLLDAPCTGTGTVHKNPEAAKKKASDVSNCTALQKPLLEAGLTVLKKGGTLVYSTCSVLPEENEQIVSGALKRGFGLKNIEHGAPALNDMKGAKRFYPSVHGTQGFFVAKIQR
ncbi:RsmB/NOP family class I SAM-dependent RNA methyltransferase [archaeon]|nr:RsmB/NOP family class I SAM-dependent RNA methyltransferase [archaeon]